MRQALKILNRIMLVLGVLVTLTPCNACQKDVQGQAHCTMTMKGQGMNCCHHPNTPSPICKAMDQVSTPAASHGLDLAATQVVDSALPLTVPPSRVVFASVVPADTSPFRAPLTLRI